MKTEVPRSRKDRALATRRRVLTAAHGLFCERGYADTTMELIAARAEVAVQTLYFTFHTKGAILGEALGAAIIGFDRFTPQPEEFDTAQAARQLFGWWPAFESQRDARQALRLYVDESLVITQRTAPLWVTVQAAASDPDVRAVWSLGERRRVESFREVARVLRKKTPHCKPGVSLALATDLLLVYLGPALYHDLSHGRGWSHPRCRRFVHQALQQQLYGE